MDVRWSCRESNPLLYQGFCPLTCRFVTSRSRSVPLVNCGYFSGLDGVKTCHSRALPSRDAEGECAATGCRGDLRPPAPRLGWPDA